MAFPAIDLFALVVAADACYRRRFDAVAIETTSRRMLVWPSTPPYHGSYWVMNAVPSAVVALDPKVLVDTLPFRILFWQHPPLDPAGNDVQHAIDDLPHIQAARLSANSRRWNKFLDSVPLTVGQVAWVVSLVHNDDSYHDWPDSYYFQTASQSSLLDTCIGDNKSRGRRKSVSEVRSSFKEVIE